MISLSSLGLGLPILAAMQLHPGTTEVAVLEALRADARNTFGQERAGQIDGRLSLAAHWIWLVAQQPLDLLDEEPDANGR